MANPWLPEIAKMEEQLGIPTGLLQAISSEENRGGDPNVVSTAAFPGSSGGAVGIMQVLPSTFAGLKRLGKIPQNADIRDPLSNILAGGHVLKEGLEAAGGDITKAIAYYNTNPKRALSGDWLPETKAYVPKVLAAFQRLTGGKGPTTMATATAPATSDSDRDGDNDKIGLENATQELMGSLMENKVTGIQTGRDLQAIMEAMRAQGAAAATAEEAKGTAAASQELLRGQKAGALQAQMAAVMEGLGLSPDQADNYRGQVLADITNVAAERAQIRQSITARKSVGIFDNPIEWFLNQLALPGEIGRHNALLQDQMAKENELTYRNLQANTDLNRSITIHAQQTAEELNQSAMQKLEDAKAGAAKSKMLVESHAAQTAMQIQNLASGQVQDDARLYGVYKDKIALKMAEEEAATRKKHMDQILAAGDAASELNAEKKAEREAAAANLANANAFWGRSDTKETIARMRPDQKELYSLAIPMDGVIGRDFPEALKAALTFANPVKMALSNKPQAEFIEGLRKLQASERQALTKEELLMMPKEPDRQLKASQNIAAKFEKGVRNVDLPIFSSGTNPYKASYDSLITQPGLGPKENAVAKVVTTWKEAENGTTRDLKDGMIFGWFAKETKPEHVQAVAQHISNFYSAAVAQNAKSYAFEIFHLPKQTAYMIQLDGKPLDLTNQAAVANVLLQKVSVQAALDLTYLRGF